jgi:hypothetical protein
MVASNQPYHTEKSESSVSIFTTVRSAVNPYAYKGFTAFIQTEEELIISAFSQYSWYSRNSIVRLTQSVLLFPFHFFW